MEKAHVPAKGVEKQLGLIRVWHHPHDAHSSHAVRLVRAPLAVNVTQQRHDGSNTDSTPSQQQHTVAPIREVEVAVGTVTSDPRPTLLDCTPLGQRYNFTRVVTKCSNIPCDSFRANGSILKKRMSTKL